MNIYEINVSREYRKIVDHIKYGLNNLFLRYANGSQHKLEGDIYVVNHFPAATDGFGETELLIFINIPDKKGNYYCHLENNKRYYLNSLVIGIKMMYDDSIINADDTTLYSSDGCLNYIDELENEKYNLLKFSSCCNNSLRNCAYFYWIVTSQCKKSFTNNFILFNTRLDIAKILYSACHRAIYKQGIKCFGKVDDLGIMVRNYIDEANSRTEIGILTKNRIDKITEKGVKTPLRVLANQGKTITILRGKAGSGKTLMLTRVFYNVIASGQHCRFLTFNHLLIFDLKHCLRRIPAFRNTNAYIHTLHYFFYHFSKKMGIHSLFTEKRFKELMDVCMKRIDIADEYILLLKKETDKWPNNEQFWGRYKDEIDSGDVTEITKYLKFLENNIYSIESLEKLREAYIQKRKDLLSNELGNELFIADYNKVLENTYLMLDNPHEFYEKYNIRDRRELLNLMSKTDKKEDEDFASEYQFEEFSQDVQNAVMHTKWWSKSVLIDEAQDCNNYEKLILMKVYGAENIVVTSGGKDQLIRTSLVTDWTHALEKTIPADFPTLTGRCYRQKENIVKFVNSFGEHYNITSPIKSANESHGLGRVIIDTRSNIRGFSNETLSQIREEGRVHGCSDYENCLVLLPTTGYSYRTKEKGIIIDELDNVDIIDKSTNRKLEISNHDLKIWNGIVERKGKLSVPAANQTRFIYYESCRGLEAWNVLCVDLDSFFYTMRSSKDAELYVRNAVVWYANNNQILFSDNDNLRNEFALHWVYMAITRPIDTLYIKLAVPSNEFSQKIIEIGQNCGAEILCDYIGSNTTDEDLPF